jgi:hypothetical protein
MVSWGGPHCGFDRINDSVLKHTTVLVRRGVKAGFSCGAPDLRSKRSRAWSKGTEALLLQLYNRENLQRQS